MHHYKCFCLTNRDIVRWQSKQLQCQVSENLCFSNLCYSFTSDLDRFWKRRYKSAPLRTHSSPLLTIPQWFLPLSSKASKRANLHFTSISSKVVSVWLSKRQKMWRKRFAAKVKLSMSCRIWRKVAWLGLKVQKCSIDMLSIRLKKTISNGR